MLIAHLAAGGLDPDGDVAPEFLDWRQDREDFVSGKVHCQAVRVEQRSFEDGRKAGLSPASPKKA